MTEPTTAPEPTYDELRVGNMATLQRLLPMVGNIDTFIMKMRIDVLVGCLIPAEQRGDFEMAFERHMATVLVELESQVDRARLLQGVRGVQ